MGRAARHPGQAPAAGRLGNDRFVAVGAGATNPSADGVSRPETHSAEPHVLAVAFGAIG